MKIDNFEKWLTKIQEPAKEKLYLHSMVPVGNQQIRDLNDIQNLERNTNIQNAINEAVQKSLNEPVTFVLSCEPLTKNEIIFPIQDNKTFNPYKISKNKNCNFFELSCKKGDLIVEGAIINKLIITGDTQKSVHVKNCCVKVLQIESGRLVNLNLDNCLIGELLLRTLSLNTLTLKKGGIISISCPPPDRDNPFFGPVIFQDVYFPTSKSFSNFFKGPQQYRNFRSHFESLQNSPAASLMRAKELASERETDKGLSKLFNYMYFFVSDYGLRPGRPLFLLLFLYIFMAGYIFVFDGTRIDTSKKPFEELIPSIKEKAKRALILPMQTMLNPAGIFRNNQIMSAQTWKGKIIILFLSLIAYGLIIFTISGLRKRFKIH